MIHRLVSIPLSPSDFRKELDTIIHIAKTNDIKIDIEKLVRKKLISRALDAMTSLPRDRKKEKKNEKWIRLPYLGNLTSKLSRLLKPFNFRPAFYSINTTRTIFSKLKDPVTTENKSGVYRLQCSDCPTVYIGQTGRKLKERVSEHERATRSQSHEPENPPPPFAAHILASGHTFDRTSGVRLLHEEDNLKRRIALENLEIKKAIFDKNFRTVNEEIPPFILADLIYGITSNNDNNDDSSSGNGSNNMTN